MVNETDRRCRVTIDGETSHDLNAGESLEAPIAPGPHELRTDRAGYVVGQYQLTIKAGRRHTWRLPAEEPVGFFCFSTGIGPFHRCRRTLAECEEERAARIANPKPGTTQPLGTCTHIAVPWSFTDDTSWRAFFLKDQADCESTRKMYLSGEGKPHEDRVDACLPTP